jgi:two-component system cell cycle response regulator
MVFPPRCAHALRMPPTLVDFGPRRELYSDRDRRSPDGHARLSERAVGAAFCSEMKDALLELLTEQNDALAAHLAEVAELATLTAVRLGLSPSEVELTRLGAELHDIGTIAIPTTILDKPGPLDAEEQWFVQRHSEIGERILEAKPALREVAPIVRAVHERPDGLGYPDGLLLEAIPVSARIICVVDAFDAMTRDRPYQRAMPVGRALAELALHAGTQFDPAVVDAFTQAITDRA